MFVGVEALRRISVGELHLDTDVPVEAHNRVGDPFGLVASSRINVLDNARAATVELLLHQMLNASSNTAANVLIDLLGRNRVNAEVVAPSGWAGSEVTRKFFSRAWNLQSFQQLRQL